jgi:DNA-binding LacI/PurR family transcriptional regulator
MTVSRYLRFNGVRTREDPRGRVKAAIAELDYRPNLAARAMRTPRTGRLAILFPFGSAVSSVHMLTGATEATRSAGGHRVRSDRRPLLQRPPGHRAHAGTPGRRSEDTGGL